MKCLFVSSKCSEKANLWPQNITFQPQIANVHSPNAKTLRKNIYFYFIVVEHHVQGSTVIETNVCFENLSNN